MSSIWIIEDWAGNRVQPEAEFESFEDARAEIDELATIECDNNHKRDTPEWEELYEGICEDLYAIEVQA